MLIRPLAVAGIEPYATRLKAKPDEIIQMYLPQEINIVVAGGETQGGWKMFAGRCATRPFPSTPGARTDALLACPRQHDDSADKIG